MKRLARIVCLILAMMTVACNSSGILEKVDRRPVIRFDAGVVQYTVKVGRVLNVVPQYDNVGDDTLYEWSIDGEIVSSQSSLNHVFDSVGRYYVKLTAANGDDVARAEIVVTVVELAPAVIVFDLPEDGLSILVDNEYILSPEVLNADDQTVCEWYLDGELVESQREYRFLRGTTGDCLMRMTACNEDGGDELEFTVHVVDGIPAEVTWESSYCKSDPLVRYVALGRSIELYPYVWNGIAPAYEWRIEGQVVCRERSFAYTPAAEGQTEVVFTLSDVAQSTTAITRHVSRSNVERSVVRINVVCCRSAEPRPASEQSSPYISEVFDYTPAPGQFVNDVEKGGFSGENTYEAANAFAASRLLNNRFISLGSWGGYIVVGFDHSIMASGGNEIAIAGNQFDTSSEPGIIWVMQDTNGNGLPDDEWFELRGSETGKPETRQRHAAIYTRPSAARASSPWLTIDGEQGTVDYLASYHSQDYYYPAWVESDRLTLYGTRLQSRTWRDESVPTEYWILDPFGWGYADNYGCDRVENWTPSDDPALDSRSVVTYHHISNAMNADGSPADLAWIDFIKVQTGVLDKAGWLGENSTSIVSIADNTMRRE
ncbi:MAG: cell surface protein [Alistipes sp.]|nr:cell surface protein [Alistipes sp.]